MKLEEYGRPPFSTQPHPWLVILHGKKIQKQTFYSISENWYYVRTIPELRYTKICAYAYGWLVLLDCHSDNCYLWNPSSNDKIQLPPLPKYKCVRCLLSAPPHDPECRVVFLINETNHNDEDDTDEDEDEHDDDNEDEDTPPTLYFCKPGYNREYHKQDLQVLNEDDDVQSWTVFKGKIYGLTFQELVVVISDVDHESGLVKIQQLLINQPICGDTELLDMPKSARYLVQSNDKNELFYVWKRYFGKEWSKVYVFQVFRLDFVEKSWVEVKSIGETAIFLSGSGGMSCSTRGTNLEKESIYFTADFDRHLHIFNLKTKTIMTSLPCQHVSKKNSSFCWLPL